jgi:hypothetical protein
VIKYKNLAAIDLKRNSTVQYTRNLQDLTIPLPNACPNIDTGVPVFNTWTDDFNRPDSIDLGPNYDQFHTGCQNIQNNPPVMHIVNNTLQYGSDPVLNDTSLCPSANLTRTWYQCGAAYYTPIPFTVKDQRVSITFVNRLVNDPTPLSTNVARGELLVSARCLLTNEPNSNQFYEEQGLFPNNIHAAVISYIGGYAEVINWPALTFQSGILLIRRADFRGAPVVLAGVATPQLNFGDVIMLTAANFISGGVEGVCLKLYVNGVLKASANDFALPNANQHGKILTGAMGVYSGGAVISNTLPNWLYGDNWLAEQVGPNPT